MYYIHELIIALFDALKLSLMIEIELFNRVNDEEFKLLRLNKAERCQELLKNIKVCIFK